MAIRIQIDVDERGAVTGIKKIDTELNKFDKQTKKSNKSLAKTNVLLKQMKTVLPALTAGYAAYKGLQIARYTLEVAGSFEVLQISLDTITKGRGPETFEKLNKWALKMPVSTQGAIKSFQMMSAMGLKPAIKDMTTLVDTASALGGRADTLDGIARALGQMFTKGKATAEELRQLAERGVPAYEILKEELKLTGEEVGNIGDLAIDGQKAVDALLTGMNKRFAGQAEKIRGTYQGINTEIKSNWKEWIRLVMDTGPFEGVKGALKEIRDLTDDMVKRQEKVAERVKAARSLEKKGIDPEKRALGLFSQAPPGETGVKFRSAPARSVLAELTRGDILNLFKKDSPRPFSNRQLDFEIALQEGAKKAKEMSEASAGTAGKIQNTGLMLELLNNDLAEYRRNLAIFDVGRLKGLPQFETKDLPFIGTKESPALVGEAKRQKLRQQEQERPLFGREKGLLSDEREQAGPTPEDIKKQQDKILALRTEMASQSLILASDRYAAEIELLQSRFQTEFGLLKENNELRLTAEQKLAQDIDIIHARQTEEMENRLMSFVSTWGSMFDQLVGKSRSSFSDIASNFKDMAAVMAQRALLAGIGNAAFGFTAGGFGGGALSFLKSSFGFRDGGYTGDGSSSDYAGPAHKREFYFPSDVVDNYGSPFFDKLLSVMKEGGGGGNLEVNNNFTSTDRSEMAMMDDTALAERMSRVISDRKIQVL